VTGGEVSAYGGTDTFDSPLIRLAPYADTTNPGGVYILAICSLESGYPVAPRSCKYDAFKVQKGAAKVQSVLSGVKYLDLNKNGQHDAGEPGLAGWTIRILGTDGTNTSVTTDGSGNWSYTTTAHAPSAGTTTYTVSEVQQSGFTQTGNAVDQSVAAGGATVSLANFVYTVTVPNDAISAVEG
jgi:SdrD B-like domain